MAIITSSRSAYEAVVGVILTFACVWVLRAVTQQAPPPQARGADAAALQLAAPQLPFPAPAAHAEPVASYTIEARLDPDQHVVSASGVIAWRNTSSVAVKELYLHLYLNAFKNSQSAFLRRGAHGGRGSGGVRDFGWIDVQRLSVRELGGQELWKGATRGDAAHPDDETDMRVELPAAVQPGQLVHIEVAWESKLPNIVLRTGYRGSFHMVAQWFPKVARLEHDGTFAHFPFHQLSEFYADFGHYDVTVDVPEAFRIASVGKRVSETLQGGRRVERYQQSDIHDFAFSAWDRFELREAQVEGVQLRLWFPPGFEAVAGQQLEAASFGLRHFAQRYGPYPYEQLTIVHPPPGADEAGGMEYPTLITTGGAWYTPRWLGTIWGVTLHELGHQYFYGMVASNEYRWPFLDEGLTKFADGEALAEGWGPGALVDLAWPKLDESTGVRVLALEGRNGQAIGLRADQFATPFLYSSLVYGRTAVVLRTLDRVYPGTVTRALGEYARAFRYRHPTAEDFVASYTAVAGLDAAGQLRAALFERGWVDYAIESLVCGPEQAAWGVLDRPGPRVTVHPWAAEVHGQRCRLVVTRRGTMSLPVELELVASNGQRSRRTWDGQGETTTLEVVGEPIELAVIDPEHRVLLDEDLTNNAVRIGGNVRAWRVMHAGMFAAMVAMAGVSP